MASRSFNRILRSPLTRQLVSPATNRRTLVSASNLARVSVGAPLKSVVALGTQQSRGVKTIDFAGTKEVVFGNLRLLEWAICGGALRSRRA